MTFKSTHHLGYIPAGKVEYNLSDISSNHEEISNTEHG